METTQKTKVSSSKRWDRFREFLAELQPGQIVTIDLVMARTGLDTESVDAVLRALTHAQLFVQQDDTTFVRDSLWKVWLTAVGVRCDHDDRMGAVWDAVRDWRRNFLTATTPSTTKTTKTTSYVAANGRPICVGTSVLKTGTFKKSGTIKTKTLK